MYLHIFNKLISYLNVTNFQPAASSKQSEKKESSSKKEASSSGRTSAVGNKRKSEEKTSGKHCIIFFELNFLTIVLCLEQVVRRNAVTH